MNSYQNTFIHNFYPHKPTHQPHFGLIIPQNQFQYKQNSHPLFTLSNNKPKINLKDFHLQQKIITLQIQLKLQSIAHLLQPKLINIKLNAFNALKLTHHPQEIAHLHRTLCSQTLQTIFNKINHFTKRQKTKIMSKAFAQITLRSIWVSKVEFTQKSKKKITDKKDSQMLRVHSKVDENSMMHLSELMVDGDGSNYSTTFNTKNKNKELKKQKQTLSSKHNLLMDQFDQILSVHEEYLKKI